MTDATGQLDFSAKARVTDPVQSHIAADTKNASGTLSTDRFVVLRAVSIFSGWTAKQLDTRSYLDLNGKAHRRSLELKDMGLIRRDKTGKEMRLYITEKGKAKLNERMSAKS